MYTALVLDARLKRDTPDEVIRALRAMVAGTGDNVPIVERPEHPLFGTSRWSWMLTGSSAYFPLERAPQLFKPVSGGGETTEPLMLSVGMSIKNYDNEIELFLDWLTPYIEEGIGYRMYEQDDAVTPILCAGHILQRLDDGNTYLVRRYHE